MVHQNVIDRHMYYLYNTYTLLKKCSELQLQHYIFSDCGHIFVWQSLMNIRVSPNKYCGFRLLSRGKIHTKCICVVFQGSKGIRQWPIN